ncbi:MAG: hypothetical protein NZM00_06245, partial [Anaerolinea sp.]|nr:hypothetical protein [Anaerolinea sp.]
HAGLMRAAFHYLREQHSQMMNTTTLDVDDIDRFLTSPALVSEAQTIWKGLSAAEREVLSSVARAASVSIDEEVEAAIHLLMRRRLLIIDHQTDSLIIHPPIFARFLQLH